METEVDQPIRLWRLIWDQLRLPQLGLLDEDDRWTEGAETELSGF